MSTITDTGTGTNEGGDEDENEGSQEDEDEEKDAILAVEIGALGTQTKPCKGSRPCSRR